MSAGRINAGPDDLGDGRYRFLLSPPDGVDPSITLAVAEQTLFRGKFSELRAARRKQRAGAMRPLESPANWPVIADAAGVCGCHFHRQPSALVGKRQSLAAPTVSVST
jgi:hypothetical protein